MKHKALIAAAVIMMCLTGCESEPYEVEPSIYSVQMEYSDFELVTDRKTGIVYIDNEIKIPGEYVSHYYHIYTPYYGKSGMICKFIDGKVVEVQ